LVGPRPVPLIQHDVRFELSIDEDGRFKGMTYKLSRRVADVIEKSFTARAGVVMFTLALLSAKNVESVKTQPARAFRRHPGVFAGTATHSHYTLNIPGAKQLREYLRGSGDSNQKRLHLVRGHFADYEEGKGLFGKLHGKYYIAPHVRGRAERGTITKDYRISAPRIS
jgi:hypothetical protein